MYKKIDVPIDKIEDVHYGRCRKIVIIGRPPVSSTGIDITGVPSRLYHRHVRSPVNSNGHVRWSFPPAYGRLACKNVNIITWICQYTTTGQLSSDL